MQIEREIQLFETCLGCSLRIKPKIAMTLFGAGIFTPDLPVWRSSGSRKNLTKTKFKSIDQLV